MAKQVLNKRRKGVSENPITELKSESDIAFSEDILPIYLGTDLSKNKYCFYAIKEGHPRFLSYINYFYWDKGPEGVLAFTPIPPEVEQELFEFLEGKIDYEQYRKRRNSKDLSVRKVYRLPSEVGTAGQLKKPAEKEVVRGERVGVSESGRADQRSPELGREASRSETPRRRTRKPRLDEHQAGVPVVPESAPPVSSVQHVPGSPADGRTKRSKRSEAGCVTEPSSTNQVFSVGPVEAAPIKRGRGRPKKTSQVQQVQQVPEQCDAIAGGNKESKPLNTTIQHAEAEPSPQAKPKRKYTRRPKPE